jgi:hypothetical protein
MVKNECELLNVEHGQDSVGIGFEIRSKSQKGESTRNARNEQRSGEIGRRGCSCSGRSVLPLTASAALLVGSADSALAHCCKNMPKT